LKPVLDYRNLNAQQKECGLTCAAGNGGWRLQFSFAVLPLRDRGKQVCHPKNWSSLAAFNSLVVMAVFRIIKHVSPA
jgi:hypothetical protein